MVRDAIQQRGCHPGVAEAYWGAKLGCDGLMAFQASARGGWLDYELINERVQLAGNAVIFMEATIFLPVSC